MYGAPNLNRSTAAGFVEDAGVSELGFDAMYTAAHCIMVHASHSTFTGLELKHSRSGLITFGSGVGNTFASSRYSCSASCSDGTGVCLQGGTAVVGSLKILDSTFDDLATAVLLTAGGANVRIEGNEFGSLTPSNRSKAPPTLVLAGIRGLTIASNNFATSSAGSNVCSDVLLSGSLDHGGGGKPNLLKPCTGVVISANHFNPTGYDHICAPYTAVMLEAAAQVSVVDNTCSAATDADQTGPAKQCGLLSSGADTSKSFVADVDIRGGSTHWSQPAPTLDLLRPGEGNVLGSAPPFGLGESNLHTFHSAGAFMRNFAQGATPVTWVPLGGAARPSITGWDLHGVVGLDGGVAYTWMGRHQAAGVGARFGQQPERSAGAAPFYGPGDGSQQ